MTAIEKVINIALNEVGYLEKKSNSNLYDKTKNAGSSNYTKYWAEIKPDYQGQPWCACFVTWCFVKAFGKENTVKLLKHYPYVYVPTLTNLFKRNANPKVGDIVCFYHSGTFTHTGLVIGVNGDYFTTIEGNTSSESSIVANGGGVFKKGYYNSRLPGTKFISPNYDVIESEDLTMSQYEELKKEIQDLKSIIANQGSAINGAIELLKKLANPMIYNYIDGNSAKISEDTNECLQKLVDRGVLKGNENGELMLTEDMIRIYVTLYRIGLFD